MFMFAFTNYAHDQLKWILAFHYITLYPNNFCRKKKKKKYLSYTAAAVSWSEVKTFASRFKQAHKYLFLTITRGVISFNHLLFL